MNKKRDVLRFALPDAEALDPLLEHLRACGFELPEMTMPGLLRVKDPLDLGIDFDFFKLAPSDVGTYVEHGMTQLGVMSTDFLAESGAEVWRPFTFSYASYPMVLASLQGMSFEQLTSKPVVRLATSLPNMTRDIFAARGMSIEVVPVSDVSAACVFGLVDGYVDRLVDPDALKREGFRVLELLGSTHLKLVINRVCYARYGEAISALIHRLYEHQPEPPEPMEIPFDRDDL